MSRRLPPPRRHERRSGCARARAQGRELRRRLPKRPRKDAGRARGARRLGLDLPRSASHHPVVAELPAGTVTFLFTDVESSTRLLHEQGGRYADLLAEHRRVLRDAFAKYSGVEVDTQGDAFFVAFAKASDALAAAATARDALTHG